MLTTPLLAYRVSRCTTLRSSRDPPNPRPNKSRARDRPGLAAAKVRDGAHHRQRFALPVPQADGPSVPGSLLVTFVRFVATGVTASVSYGLLFLVMGALTDAPDLMLNLVATVVSTVLSNELHRRFHVPDDRTRLGRSGAERRQRHGGHRLAGEQSRPGQWDLLVPDAGGVSTLAVAYCVNGVVGLANFLILRRVLDGRARQRPANSPLPSPIGELARAAAPRLAAACPPPASLP